MKTHSISLISRPIYDANEDYLRERVLGGSTGQPRLLRPSPVKKVSKNF
jgi:hypothetical protein